MGVTWFVFLTFPYAFVLLPYGVVSFFFSFFNFPKAKKYRFEVMIIFLFKLTSSVRFGLGQYFLTLKHLTEPNWIFFVIYNPNDL